MSIRERARIVRFLVQSEFARRYARSFGGVLWALLIPICTMLVIWIALDFGLGLREAFGPGYAAALIVALIAWQPFVDGVNDAATSIARSPHLVKKVVFPVELLPLTSVAVATIVHLALLTLIVIALLATGQLAISNLWQLPFWTALLLALISGVAVLAATANMLLRDTAVIIPFLIGLMFWLTPIVWSVSRLSPSAQALAFVNPMAVVVEGYRSALLGTDPTLDLSRIAILLAWIFALGVLARLLFRMSRPYFGDNL